MSDVSMNIYTPSSQDGCGCCDNGAGDIARLLYQQNRILESFVCSFREAYGLGYPDGKPADEYTTDIFTVREESRLYVTFTPTGTDRTLKAMIKVSDEDGFMQCNTEIITIAPGAEETSQTVGFDRVLEAGQKVELRLVGTEGTYTAQLKDLEDTALMTFHSGSFHKKET